MKDAFVRTALLLGEPAVERLKRSRVAVFGVGGVGSFAVEALARGGVGSLSLFDGDTIAVSNLNRQLIATTKTLGHLKVEVAMERVLEINPDCRVEANFVFYSPENADRFDFSSFDFIIDAIDTVSSKLELVVRANGAGTPIISCMGTGNKLDPTRFEVADLFETSVCPLARVMRRELKKRGISRLPVVYSREEALKPVPQAEEPRADTEQFAKRQTPGSVSFVPSVAGLILAGEVIKRLMED